MWIVIVSICKLRNTAQVPRFKKKRLYCNEFPKVAPLLPPSGWNFVQNALTRKKKNKMCAVDTMQVGIICFTVPNHFTWSLYIVYNCIYVLCIRFPVQWSMYIMADDICRFLSPTLLYLFLFCFLDYSFSSFFSSLSVWCKQTIRTKQKSLKRNVFSILFDHIWPYCLVLWYRV